MRKLDWIIGALALAAALNHGPYLSHVQAAPENAIEQASNEAPAAAGAGAGYAWPEGIAPELQRIQRELGGSAVDRYEALKESSSSAWATDRDGARDARRPMPAPENQRSRPASWGGRPQVEALRDAAGQVDVLANRLEQLELYSQADALREQAQHMRLDARNMSGGNRPTSRASALPTPSRIGPQHERQRARDLWNPPGVPPMSSAPTPGPSPTPTPKADEPAPAAAEPQLRPSPGAAAAPLEPTPLPENQQAPPELKPAPLQE